MSNVPVVRLSTLLLSWKLISTNAITEVSASFMDGMTKDPIQMMRV